MTAARLVLAFSIAGAAITPLRANAQGGQASGSVQADQKLDPAGLPGGLPLMCHAIPREAKDSSAFQLEFVETEPPHFVRLRRVDFDSLGIPLYAQLAAMTRADTSGFAVSGVYLAVRFDGQPRGGRVDMKDGAFVTVGLDSAWSRAKGLPGPGRAMTEQEVAHAVAFAEWARAHRCDKRAPPTGRPGKQ